jgi:arylsulfatase B
MKSLLFLWVAIPLAYAARLPHIIHILADDFGWADIGYHRTNESNPLDVQTPHLDSLVKTGIELDRFYVYKICSPSRSSIQSGRNPIHVNVQNTPPEYRNKNDPIGGYQGIPTNMTGIASVLRRAQYKTHIVGKWDVGMATELHHPRARGYQTWLGYWHHSNDYWSHTVEQCSGIGPVKDLWKYNATYDGPARMHENGRSCSQENQAPLGEMCAYEEEVLANEVLNILHSHDPVDPLFLFYSMHLVHMPLQVPTRYEEKFAFIEDSYRRLNHAMANYMDDQIGKIIDALHSTGLWNNSILVFHSDNGGEIMGAGVCGGNNYPLTGGKFSNWEGGIRANAFVTGGVIPEHKRGTKEENAFITAWDWYATYAHVAGVDPHDKLAEKAGLPPIDSINVWPYLMGANASLPRHEIIIGDTSAIAPNQAGRTLVGGIIKDGFKLLVGAEARLWEISQYVMTGAEWPNKTSHLVPLVHSKRCTRDVSHGCLFDVKNDPSERNNVASSHPEIFKGLLSRMDEAQKTVYSPDRGHRDPQACIDVKTKYTGYWGPFVPT